jgi:deaminated glutathione amidase
MRSGNLSVYLGQFGPGSDPLANSQTIRALALEASAAGADLLVCPEYSHAFTPQPGPSWAVAAESLEGPFISALTRISAEASGLVIVAGMLVGEGDKPRNTIVAVGPQGILATSEKIHLYDAFGNKESDWVSPGEIAQPEILVLGDHRVGLMACYDVRFPEVARRLVDAGATCIVVPAQWVPGPDKVEQWSALIRARAIETQCFVMGLGQPEPYGIGHSLVVDPLGKTVVALGQDTESGHAVLDVGLVSSAREANPMVSARRFGVHPL